MTVTTAPKIDYAVGASLLFADQVHRPGDQGAVLSFGNTLAVEVPFTESVADIKQGLLTLATKLKEDVCRRGKGEGTRLNDSLADTSRFLAGRGDPDHPMLFITQTDGIDTRSQRFQRDPVGTGRYIREHFTSIPGHHAFLVAVGRQVDGLALSLMGEAGAFPVVLTQDFASLSSVFERIATTVTRVVRTTVIPGPGFVITERKPGLLVKRRPLQYVLLIDRSGSMTEEA